MVRHYRKISLVLAGTILIGGLFQNCGKGVQSAVSSSTEASSDTGVLPTYNPSAPLFKAGDPLDENKLPYSPSSALINKVKIYKLNTEFKAIAMASSGYGVTVVANGVVSSQDEANVLAMERCQLYSGNLPCALLAEGNVFKYSEGVFYQSHYNSLENGARKFDGSKIPGLAYVWRAKEMAAATGYANRTNKFKAYAIGPDGAGSSGWSEATQEEANRRAMEFCENNVDQACTLYAVADDVVFNVTAFAMGSIKYVTYGPKNFVASQVPYVRDADRAGAMVDIVNRVNGGEHVVLALSRYGHFFYTHGGALNNPLEQKALDGCNATIAAGSNFKCFVYSKDLKVTFTRQILLGAK
jgi:hypothetical protein